MKILIAPDSFKESLSAPQVAAAIGEGVLRALPDARLDLCPMADGGAGTVSAMVASTGGVYRFAEVFGPTGAQMRARYGLLGEPGGANLPGELGLLGAISDSEAIDDGDGEIGSRKLAVIEMAAASGLALVPRDRRDPLRTTTFGTGQLIAAALDEGAEEIIVGLGGSATVDGGCGAAQALGVTFCGADGEPIVCGLAGGGLKDIRHIDLDGRHPAIGEVPIRLACDVNNPLVGPDGAAAVFGPQKGADPAAVAELAAGLEHLAGLIRSQVGKDIARTPGGGAAGGLAAGLVAFADAQIESGARLLADGVALRQRLAGCRLCLTGEGALDATTAAGKTAWAVAQIAAELNVPTLCIPGQLTEGAAVDAFHSVWPLVAGEVQAEESLADPAPLLARRAADAVRAFVAGAGF